MIRESLLKTLVVLKERLLGPRKGRGGGGHEGYFQWQFSSSAKLFSCYKGLELAGKSVLEIGCGIGGRTAWMATQNAARVVGIDINAEEIGAATELCAKLYPDIASRVEYKVCQENSALELGQFDYVLLVDSMEHVVSPPAILRLARQYTKPGGFCYFGTIGWFHHAGSHTGLLPWVNVLFSDESILNVMRWYVSRPDYRPSFWDSNPPIERWKGIYDLRDRPGEHLNKITLRQMKRLMRHNIIGPGEMYVYPFGNPWLRPFRWMSQVPLLQELFHSYFVVRLERRA
jgi:2-polyprenyl-3-methyl-5-hydroxy-6-metoxy-1,4-benzoquinol methylase